MPTLKEMKEKIEKAIEEYGEDICVSFEDSDYNTYDISLDFTPNWENEDDEEEVVNDKYLICYVD